MPAMVLRIDPRLTLVWRSPTDLQVGADRPDRVLAGVTPAEEQLVRALRIGTTRGGLDVVAGECGLAGHDVDRLLARLGDAVVATAPQGAPLAVALETGGLAGPAARIAAALGSAGVRLAAAGERPALAVLLAGHVVRPEAAARWLGRDVPHLAVVFGDEEVELGPMVLPGRTSCLACAARHRVAEDAAWGVIATQLLDGRHPAAAAGDAVLVHEAAVRLLRVADAVRAGSRTGLEERSLRLGRRGLISERRWPPSPGCSCRALPGTGTAPGSTRGADRPRPRTAAARIAPG